jgi:predicted GNAT family N-acyltransferase
LCEPVHTSHGCSRVKHPTNKNAGGIHAIAQLSRAEVMGAEIGVVFNRPNDRLWLLQIRQWMSANGASLEKLGIKAPVQPLSSPDDALCWRAERPAERLLVTFGFNRSEIESHQQFGISSGEPIIVANPDAANGKCVASASFLDRGPVVTCGDVRPQIRKSLIRVALRKRVEVRPPCSDEELAGYFSLRYRVWSALGFLREENKRSRIEWEIDFWDRTAVPLCAITPNGEVVGSARLIRNHGDEERCYVAKIQSLLDRVNDPKLNELFRFPNAVQHPFDVLMEFPGFRAHFKTLMRAGMKLAEVGRVAVDPDHRGQFLSEVLVDTAVSCAQARRVSCLFLACRDELGPLYAKCGFVPVPGLRSEKFFNIQLASIVMEKRI